MPRPTLSLVAASLVLAAACRDGPTSPGPADAALYVQPASVLVGVGDTATITVTRVDLRGRPLPGAAMRFWSDRPEVAAVDSLNGLVTAVAPGSATVVVTARPLQARVPVTVGPRGGTAVAGFGFDQHPDEGIRIDNWSLAPQSIHFYLRNAAGESLCGIVPLAFRSDTTVLAARYTPLPGEPCLVTLVSRGEGAGWLVARAGEVEDSVRVIAHHARYHWVFDMVGDREREVGTLVDFGLFAMSEQTGPAVGIPMTIFYWTAEGPYVAGKVSTGPDGWAMFTAVLPPHPIRTEHSYCYMRPSGAGCDSSSTAAGFKVKVAAMFPDSSQASDSAMVRLRPGKPDHIQILAYRTQFSGQWEMWGPHGWGYGRRWGKFRPLPDAYGYTLRKESFNYQQGIRGCADYFADQLAAIVADRNGNPTSMVPELSYSSTPGVHVEVSDYVEPSTSSNDDYRGKWEQIEITDRVIYVDGRVAIANLTPPFRDVALTFTAPGMESRAVRINGTESNFRRDGCG
jgi:hypothetical protein